MKRNKLIVGIGLLLIGIFALYGVATAGMTFVTEWGDSGTGDGYFLYPRGIAVDSLGNVYVADGGNPSLGIGNNRIQKFDSNGGFITKWGSYGTGDGYLQYPHDVAVDSLDYVYVADTGRFGGAAYTHRIQKFDSNGGFTTKWGSYGTGNGYFDRPRGIAVNAVTDRVYVADTLNSRIQVFESDGTFVTLWSSWDTDSFNEPHGIAVNAVTDRVYVADTRNDRILRFGSDGTYEAMWGGVNDPYGIAVDSVSGKVYVADTYNDCIQVFESDGTPVLTCNTFFNNITQAQESFSRPAGIAVANGDIYVSDTNADRILKFTLAPIVGEITAPMEPIEVGTEIEEGEVSAPFTDSDDDIHTATWAWGDGSTSPGTVDQNNDSVTGGPHTYEKPGVYTLTLTVTDDGGASGTTTFQYVVVYDSDGGFVTGGGWIDSPPDAYVADPLLTGKANFGFVSKYKNGASEPTGETEFNFKAGDMNFHSDSYEWLVVTNHKAMYKGCGTINGEGYYGFMLSAIDAALTPSTDVDLFRIKIWDKDDGDVVVYDNQMDDADDTDPTTEIDGGSIVIHQ